MTAGESERGVRTDGLGKPNLTLTILLALAPLFTLAQAPLILAPNPTLNLS